VSNQDEARSVMIANTREPPMDDGLTSSWSRRELLTLVAGVGLGGCVGRQSGSGSEVDAWVARSAKLRERLPQLESYAASTIPGFGVAVVLDGQVAWSDGYGVRSSADGRPVDSSTVFELGSLTKPLFTAAVVRLRDRGIIDLDRPLSAYMRLPELEHDPRAERVTGRHVLTQTSGLLNWRPFSGERRLELVAEPGQEFTYSGEAFVWLQRVIEHVTGTATGELIRQEVLDPLEMSRSSLVFRDEMLSNYAMAHLDADDPPEKGQVLRRAEQFGELLPARDLETVSYDEASEALVETRPDRGPTPHPVWLPSNIAGHLVSTAADYARFVAALMPQSSEAFLEKESLEEIMSPHTVINPYVSVGLGWRLERTADSHAFWHSGYNSGFHSFAFADTAGRYGVVLVTNSDRGDRLRWPVIAGLSGAAEAALLS